MTGPSLSRILRVVALVLIALSVTSRLAGLVLLRSGASLADSPGLMAVLSMTSFAVLPPA